MGENVGYAFGKLQMSLVSLLRTLSSFWISGRRNDSHSSQSL